MRKYCAFFFQYSKMLGPRKIRFSFSHIPVAVWICKLLLNIFKF